MAKPNDVLVVVSFDLFSTVNMCNECIEREALDYLEYRGYPLSCAHLWCIREEDGFVLVEFSPFVM